MRKWSVILIFTVLSLLGGCVKDNSLASLKVWACTDMEVLTPQRPAFVDHNLLDGAKNTVTLHAAANEIVSFQLIFDSTKDVFDLSVSAENLTTSGQPPIADAIDIFRMLPVKVHHFPAWRLRLMSDPAPEYMDIYDALTPLPKKMILRKDRRLAMWVDIRIPKTAKPGQYRTAIQLKTPFGPGRSASITIEVVDVVLPEAQPVIIAGGLSYRDIFRQFLRQDDKPFDPVYLDPDQPSVAEGLKLLRQALQMGHAHRLDMFESALTPRLGRDLKGRVKLDWKAYDRIVKPYLTGWAFSNQIGVRLWPLPFSGRWPNPANYGGPETEQYKKTAGEVLNQLSRHVDSSLNGRGKFFAWPVRTDPLEAPKRAYRDYLQLAALIRKADPSLPILSRLPAISLGGVKAPIDLMQAVDLHAPIADAFDPAARILEPNLADQPLAGLWLCPDRPPFLPSLSVLSNPADARILPWLAMKTQSRGIFLPNVLHWDIPQAKAISEKQGRENRLLYPGTLIQQKRILPSVRLKRLRNGLQDTACLWILQQRHKSELAEVFMNAMCHQFGRSTLEPPALAPRQDGWELSPAAWSTLHKLLLKETADCIHKRTLADEQAIARKVLWRSAHHRAGWVRIETLRSSIQPIPGADRFLARLALELTNRHAVNTECEINFGPLPKTWVAKPDILNLEAPAKKRVEFDLRVEGERRAFRKNGKVAIPATLMTQFHPKPYAWPLEIGFLQAGWFHAPPKIDGKLDEWPRRAGAAAAGFLRIGVTPTPARRQSIVYVFQDKDNLYFGIVCDEPTPAKMKIRNTNAVQYDQFMARGEDLFEIILDPGRKARRAEDLYHLIIKPNGIMIAELGLPTPDQPNRARNVTLKAKVAAAQQKSYWTAEIKIPKTSFGADAKSTLWGVNFARFAYPQQEPSCWLATHRDVYDPRRLGTLNLPEKE